jgi:hypothetical protein
MKDRRASTQATTSDDVDIEFVPKLSLHATYETQSTSKLEPCNKASTHKWYQKLLTASRWETHDKQYARQYAYSLAASAGAAFFSAFLAAGFLVAAFLVDVFLVAAFLVDVFLVAAFLVDVFLVAAFLVAVFLVVAFFLGACAVNE